MEGEYSLEIDCRWCDPPKVGATFSLLHLGEPTAYVVFRVAAYPEPLKQPGGLVVTHFVKYRAYHAMKSPPR